MLRINADIARGDLAGDRCRLRYSIAAKACRARRARCPGIQHHCLRLYRKAAVTDACRYACRSGDFLQLAQPRFAGTLTVSGFDVGPWATLARKRADVGFQSGKDRISNDSALRHRRSTGGVAIIVESSRNADRSSTCRQGRSCRIARCGLIGRQACAAFKCKGVDRWRGGGKRLRTEWIATHVAICPTDASEGVAGCQLDMAAAHLPGIDFPSAFEIADCPAFIPASLFHPRGGHVDFMVLGPGPDRAIDSLSGEHPVTRSPRCLDQAQLGFTILGRLRQDQLVALGRARGHAT